MQWVWLSSVDADVRKQNLNESEMVEGTEGRCATSLKVID